ncbi:diguanylate cyclase domain-containing protein [Lysobacter korlensis]|uniref:Diguanylate cyclase domain-containing protein n=1 Tax=Lysobacter korlensis TaxID=553636 RepID=A0ABV6RUS3_9GAMM
MAEPLAPIDRPQPNATSDIASLRVERDRLRVIVEGLTHLVSLNLPTAALLDQVLECVMSMTSATGAVVGLVDGDVIEYVATAGSVAEHRSLRVPVHGSLSGLAVCEGGLQVCTDALTDPRVDRAACERTGVRSMLVMPLCHLGGTLGMLKVASPAPDAFDDTDQCALRLAAGIAGNAIGRERVVDENRRLYESRMQAYEQATTVLAASPTATIVHDLDGTVRMWNAAAETLLGWSADEVVGGPPPVGEGGMARFLEISARIVRDGPATTEIVRRPRKDGGHVDVRVSGAPLRDEHGHVTGIVRTLEDVSGFHAHAESLKAATERLRTIIEHSHAAFVSMDETGRVIEWNRAAEVLFGWTRQQALLRPLEDLILPEATRDAHRHGLQRFLASRQSQLIGRRIQVVGQRHDGTQVPLDLSINTATIDGRPVFDAFMEDITERRAELDQLRQQVLLDMLTQLPGREYFQGQLRVAIERNRDTLQRAAVVVLNLDGFRAINELYGHATGDAVLRECARRLQEAVRDHDTVTRLGGDEFAVLLDGLRDAREDAPVVAAKLMATFDEPVALRLSALPLSVSVGVALHEYPQDDVESLLHRAHEALWTAKRAGGGRTEMLARDRPAPE